MRPLALACLLLLSGCVSPELAVQTSPPASASPSAPSPLPSGVIDPQPLIDRATHLTSIVLRVDRVTAKLTTLSDFMEGSGAVRAGASPGQRIWVVAIRGDIRIDAIIDVPHGQCALFASDAAGGDVLAARSGPATICDPYFN